MQIRTKYIIHTRYPRTESGERKNLGVLFSLILQLISSKLCPLFWSELRSSVSKQGFPIPPLPPPRYGIRLLLFAGMGSATFSIARQLKSDSSCSTS